jgi:hypothetical protein
MRAVAYIDEGLSPSAWTRNEPLSPPEQAPSLILDLAAATTTGPAKKTVELLTVRPPDRHPVQPFQVLEVLSCDLAQRPARITTEVQNRAGRVAGRRTRSPFTVGSPHPTGVVAATMGRSTAGPIA